MNEIKENIRNNATIPVRVDRSHIVTIGRRLYSESVELIRELVNNAYDADATEVRVTIREDEIEVGDNGLGMDREGLEQYFNIGSQEKLYHDLSPKFQRQRIGQFGIGKFASLSAADRFVVWTRKGDFSARVIFDREEWEKGGGTWELPLEILEPLPGQADGTRVTLSQVTRRLDPFKVERKVIESVPIKAPDFAVYVNDSRVRSVRVPGRKLPFLEGTEYGLVHGEIILASLPRPAIEDIGIEVKVKGVTVRRDLFGMEQWGRGAERIMGEIHADFLPVTSDRNRFVIDSPEYGVFLEAVEKLKAEIKIQFNQLQDKKENRKISRALREALERVEQALLRNLEICPEGMIPVGEGSDTSGDPALPDAPGKKKDQEKEEKGRGRDKQPRKKKAARPHVRKLTPSAVVKRVKMGYLGVTCCIDHYGPEGPECFSEGGVIYINRDHPLYKREIKTRQRHMMHVARLITQEIAMMREPISARQAFDRQSLLLRDAFKPGSDLAK
ncbi:MAG: ATP-binding protein [Candidatus Auribacterota bacterium]|nr:ATP-binding protein [Candidatus Auribacterota bacterium]